MKKHINILGSLFLIFSSLMIIAGFVTHYMLGTMKPPGGMPWDMGDLFGLIILLISVPQLICGYGLLTKKSWSRIFGIILSCLSLLRFPIGTVIGIYGLWVLFKDETKELLSSNNKQC